MTRSVLVSCATIGVLMLLACSGKTNGSGVGGAPLPMSEYGKRITSTLCPAIEHCCRDNGFTDPSKKCADGEAKLQADVEASKAKHPTWVWDDVKAGNCFARLVNAYSDCNLGEKNDLFERDTDCRTFFTGGVKAGEHCDDKTGCSPASGYGVCVGDGTSTTSFSGTCVAYKVAAAGDPCGASSKDLDTSKTYGDCEFGQNDDFFCNVADKKCAPRLSEGADCGTDVSLSEACKKGLVCGSSSKKCEAAPKAGESCANNSACAEGAACDSASRKCVALRHAGEACDPASAELCEHGCDSQSGKCRANDVKRDMCEGNFD